jgi:hypothetical protein
LAIYHKKWNLFRVTIHESGRYTLLGTIFYFNHFMRELFIDTFFVFAAYRIYRIHQPESTYEGGAGLALVAFSGFLIVVILGSLKAVGLKNTLLDLFQYRQLDHIVRFGSHWQMHFLSTLVILLLLILPATLYIAQPLTEAVVIILLFFVVSFVFRTGKSAISDPRWLMHGGREIITFFFLAVSPTYAMAVESPDLEVSPATLLLGLAIAGILFYIFSVYRQIEIKELAQSGHGMAYLLTSHFFEHVLDYVYMLLLMVLLIRLTG